jgi:predicted amidophosphoribosyltransferase
MLGRESREAVDGPGSLDWVLLEDVELMQRIDQCHSGDFVRENHPDRCPGCGNIEPGFRSCRRCGHRLKRKVKDAAFCFQEVAGATQHQDALGRSVSAAECEEDGGFHEWVTAVLTAEPSKNDQEQTVKVMASSDRPGELLGFIPQDEAAAIHKALMQVDSAHKKSVACKALIRGGVRRQDGSTSAYGIRLLLPESRDIPKAVKAALEAE